MSSTPSRRTRVRAETRERILETASRILETDGAAALTMRRVAGDMDYTAPVVYQHFAGKDALVQELIAQGFRSMVAEFEPVLSEADVDRRVLGVAAAYVRFAGQHPHLYGAMNGTVVRADARRAAAEPTFEVVLDLMASWSDVHGVELVDRAEACEILWGTLAGMASIGYLDTIGNERAQRLAQEAVSAILRGWRSGSGTGGHSAFR